jgi:environmental stress-induced protein Ves
VEKDGSRLDGLRRLGPEDYTVSAWSGGSTTQIAIAPEGARYADRDFLWRVSSATVELPESDFTPLPDYDRLIATLRGEICLRHNGGAPLQLMPYQVHAFSGAEATHASGCCTDFNLMLRRGAAAGSMEALRPEGRSVLTPHPGTETLLLYCVEGGCAVSGEGERETLQAGETLLLSPRGPLSLEPERGAARLMLCQLWRGKGGAL